MKKRTIGMIVAAASLSLCMGMAAQADEFKVAYIARAQEDSFAAWLADEMRAAFDEYDDMTLDVFDGQANDEKENSLIENAIANGYDGIIIQANNGEAQLPYI
ncbi:MAG: substrate-binding domain-containing protein, partial [Lachnospiraceae bacterium]|nr:substrate-binding domain-containing protein [Lachnospiraceae bacterium]